MEAALETTPRQSARPSNSLVLVVHSGDFDRMMAAFILATTAAAVGQQVTMFFNFWGLLGLRERRRLKGKTLLDRLLALALPSGFGRVTRMNFFGFGSRFFGLVMRRKNVSGLDELREQANLLGVKMIACSTSMEVMGVHADELCEGVEIGGAILCLQRASESGATTLFI